MITAASFIITGSGLESFGLFRIVRDQQGQQSVVGPYGLLLNGLCFRVDEQWAPTFVLPSTGWTQSFATPTNGWTLAFTPPSTSWTLAF